MTNILLTNKHYSKMESGCKAMSFLISYGICTLRKQFHWKFCDTVASNILMPEHHNFLSLVSDGSRQTWPDIKDLKAAIIIQRVGTENTEPSRKQVLFDFILLLHRNIALAPATWENNISIRRNSCVVSNEKTEGHPPSLTHLIASVRFAIHPSSQACIWVI